MRKNEDVFLHVGGSALPRTLWSVSYGEAKPGGWFSNLYDKSTVSSGYGLCKSSPWVCKTKICKPNHSQHDFLFLPPLASLFPLAHGHCEFSKENQSTVPTFWIKARERNYVFFERTR